jgi:hypothetical protein
VGDFLRFKSCVLYTELDDPKKPLINVEVVAHVTRPEGRTSEVRAISLSYFKMYTMVFEINTIFHLKTFTCCE